ncbi:MAG: ABC transporter substrate-binding protein [Desulfobulbaceae bacterium]
MHHCSILRKWILTALLSGPAVLLLCLLLPLHGFASPPPGQVPFIRIGHAPNDHHSPLYIAAMNPDYFRTHGGLYLKQITFRKEYQLMDGERLLANLIITSSAGGEKLVRTLDEGLNDLSFGGVPALFSFIDKGSEIKILSPTMADGSGLVVRPDLPARNWQEFVALARTGPEPLRIGYKTALSVQVLILEAALRAEQIAYSKDVAAKGGARVILMNLAEEKNLLPALENGIIDGFVINQPFVAMAEDKGSGRTLANLSELPPKGSWQLTPCCALAGNTRYVAAHPLEVEAALTLFLRANRYITEHPEESSRQVAEWLGVAPEVERLSLPTITFTTDYSGHWHRGVDFWIDSMVEAGKLKNRVKKARETNSLPATVYDMEIYFRARENIK